MLSRKKKTVIAGALAVSTSLGGVGVWSASAAPETGEETVAVELRTVTVARVAGAAAADGTVPVVLGDGSTASLPADRVADALRASQTQQVAASCGTAYIRLRHKSNGRPVRMETGFDLSGGRRAVGYVWRARIEGPDYGYNYSASGGLRFRDKWNGSHDSGDNYPHGTYRAAATGTVSLSNGNVCGAVAGTARRL
ncbi:hypothetical protein EV193_12028 [Herbihabitans rhizosphaerae]|uniref:Uncharacterized protein n=1 Tax=Herbihabitans rhizosphaerae TaxID=1872711 RepID=A0A4Q7KB82_9PSEU|nr:hypothetical protein [Herbihabitans rhizosphaerae]RZS29543.1 hypothetical protein EV193_12028 [Herbihabitans rhizosphaerae]